MSVFVISVGGFEINIDIKKLAVFVYLLASCLNGVASTFDEEIHQVLYVLKYDLDDLFNECKETLSSAPEPDPGMISPVRDPCDPNYELIYKPNLQSCMGVDARFGKNINYYYNSWVNTEVSPWEYHSSFYNLDICMHMDSCPYGYAVSFGKKICEPLAVDPKNNGRPSCSAGNPINIATGNKYQSDIDYIGSGMIKITRHYNSFSKDDFGFGVGWTSFLQKKLIRIGSDIIKVIRSDGRNEKYERSDGVWVGDPDSLFSISEDEAGFKVYKVDGGYEYYDLGGKLLTETSSQGHAVLFEYDVNCDLISVTGPYGRQLSIFRDHINGRIKTISTPDNGVLSYQYDDLGNLVGFANQENKTRRYHYGDSRYPNALTGITNEKGARYASWSYDDHGRAIFSEHANGIDIYKLTFNQNGSTSVTNPLGKSTTYNFIDSHGVKKVSSVEGHPIEHCEGANKSYTYD
ncbi:MAG: DUF6531 domain-containing protein, partial [Sedimenticola sp.]